MLAVNQVLLIFKTNISTQEKVNNVSALLKNNPLVLNWSIDLLDVDYVLTIEAINGLTEQEVQDFLIQKGYQIEPLD